MDTLSQQKQPLFFKPFIYFILPPLLYFHSPLYPLVNMGLVGISISLNTIGRLRFIIGTTCQ